MPATVYYSPFIPAFSSNGAPVPGAKLYFYLTGTTTKTPIYTTDAMTTELTNPVEADASGMFPNIYLDDAVIYRVEQTDSDDVPLGDAIDPYVPGTALMGEKGDPGGDASQVGPRNDFVGMNIPAGTDKVTLTGYAAAGDSPPVILIRRGAEPPSGAGIQAGDGSWWEVDYTHHNGIPVWFFGSLGASEDEFLGIKQASEAANFLEVPTVYDGTKTYIIDQNNGQSTRNRRFGPFDGKRFHLNGNGATLKFKDNTLVPTDVGKFYHLIGIYIEGYMGNLNADVPEIYIENFVLDGNLRGQPDPASPSNYEQCASLRVQGAPNGGRIRNLRIDNIRTIDPIADDIVVGASANVAYDDDGDGVAETAAIATAHASNIHHGKRTGARAAQAWGSQVSEALIENCYVEQSDGDIQLLGRNVVDCAL